MSTQEIFVQEFTRLFQHYTSAFAPPKERPEGASCNAVPSDECNRLVAAARLALLELEADAQMQKSSRRYFAKPGEAEWGC